MDSLEKSSAHMTRPAFKHKEPAPTEAQFADPKVRTFFRSFWKDERYLSFFLATKDEIFLGDYSPENAIKHIPYLFYIHEPRNASSHGSSILSAIAESGESIKEQVYLPQKNQSSKEDFFIFASALVLLHLHRIVQKNPILAEELAKSELAYGKLVSLLTRNWNEFKVDVFTELRGIEEAFSKNQSIARDGDPALLQLLNKLLAFAKDQQKDYIDTGRLLHHSHQREAIHIDLCTVGYEQQSILLAGEEDDESYDSLLFDLYAKKLISTISIVNWCSHCVDEPFVSASVSQLSPQHARFKCPKCRHEQCVAGAYKMNDNIRDIVFSKDGLIGGAVAWLLSEHNIDFDQSSYVGDIEMDFLFFLRGELILVECKQHKGFSEKEFNFFRTNLVKDASQLKRAQTELAKEGTIVNKSILLINYAIDDLLAQNVEQMRKTHTDIFSQDLMIMDCQMFQRYITGKSTE